MTTSTSRLFLHLQAAFWKGNVNMKRVVRASVRDLKEYERVEIPEDRMGVLDAAYSLVDRIGAEEFISGLLRELGTDELANMLTQAYDLRGLQYVKNSKQFKNKRPVKASVVPLEDGEDYSSDVSSDVARDVLYECADMFGADSVLDYVLRYFSAWDFKPVADDFLNDNDLKYE